MKQLTIILLFVTQLLSAQIGVYKDTACTYKDSIVSMNSIYAGQIVSLNTKSTNAKQGTEIMKAFDRSENGNDSFASDSSFAPILYEESMLFDGVNDRLENSNNSLNPYDKEFTISVWVKIINFTQSTKIIISKGASGGSGWMVYVSLGNLPAVEFYDGSGTRNTVISSNPINDDNWHNITGIHKHDGYTYLYVDGSFIKKGTVQFLNEIKSIYNFKIGCSYVNTAFFGGYIDKIRIYNRSLTDSEIEYIYNNNL